MDEATAKTKWCPFVKIVPSFEPRDNGNGCQCIASDCMAWRWEAEVRGFSQTIHPGEQPAPLVPIYTGLLSKTEGRCGLAGPP